MDGAETGETAARGRGQARPGPALAAHGPARRRPRVGWRTASELPGQWRRRRHCAPLEQPARPGEVRGPVIPIPSSFGRFGPLLLGAAAAATAALGPAQPRSPRASRPQGSVQRTGARHPLPHRLPASRDVSTSRREEHVTKYALSARKMRMRTARGSARWRCPVAR